MAKKSASPRPSDAATASPRLLTGGNPQIAKADGDAPLQAYIAAMPGWKAEVGRWLDGLIVDCVPDVRKAVRWNTPFYGLDGRGWFIAYNCCTKYVKITFFRGTSLRPEPPVASKMPNVRYFHLFEHDTRDENMMRAWIEQAAALPGETVF